MVNLPKTPRQLSHLAKTTLKKRVAFCFILGYNNSNKERLSMKTFVIASSDYMGEEQTMRSMDCTDLKECLLNEFGTSNVRSCKQANGDGMPFITIFDIEVRKQVFP